MRLPDGMESFPKRTRDHPSKFPFLSSSVLLAFEKVWEFRFGSVSDKISYLYWEENLSEINTEICRSDDNRKPPQYLIRYDSTHNNFVTLFKDLFNMLSDIEFQEIQTSLFPPRLKSTYSDFHLVTGATTFKVFQAKARGESQQVHTIRVLDLESEAVKEDRDRAVTLFFQEVLRYATTHPAQVVIEEFEVAEDKIAFVTKPYTTLENLIKEEKKSQINIEKLIRNMSSDLEFLLNKMRFESANIDLNNIYKNNENDTYFLGDWITNLSKAPVFQRWCLLSKRRSRLRRLHLKKYEKWGQFCCSYRVPIAS